MVEALAINSGGIDTRIHDIHGLVEALAIKSGGIDTRYRWLGSGTTNKSHGTCIDTPLFMLVPLPSQESHVYVYRYHHLVEALAIKSGGIDTRIHDFPGLVEALAIKSGGIDTRIHDFPGLVEALAIKSGGIDTPLFIAVPIHHC